MPIIPEEQKEIALPKDNEQLLFSQVSLKRINYTPTDWSKYDGLPVKPGVLFFKAFTICKSEALKHLRILIPDTLISFEKLAWLKYGNSYDSIIFSRLRNIVIQSPIKRFHPSF